MNIQQTMSRTASRWGCSIALVVMNFFQTVLAAPQKGFPQAPPDYQKAGETGDWLKLIKNTIGQGGIIIGLTLSVVAFVWVGYAALSKFNEARTGRAEWSELAVLAIAGAVILIFIAILLTQMGSGTDALTLPKGVSGDSDIAPL